MIARRDCASSTGGGGDDGGGTERQTDLTASDPTSERWHSIKPALDDD